MSLENHVHLDDFNNEEKLFLSVKSDLKECIDKIENFSYCVNTIVAKIDSMEKSIDRLNLIVSRISNNGKISEKIRAPL